MPEQSYWTSRKSKYVLTMSERVLIEARGLETDYSASVEKLDRKKSN